MILNVFADILTDPEWEGPRDPLDLDPDDVTRYLDSYTAPQGQMRAQILRACRSFYSFCVNREVLLRSPFAEFPIARPKYPAAPSLVPSDLAGILEAAEQIDPRARWAIQLQYTTGCRVASMIALTPEDIHRGPMGVSVHFRTAKYDRPYVLPLDGPAQLQAVEELVKLRDYRPPRAARRPTLIGVGYERYRQWLKAAGLVAGVDVWTHLLRHTAATRLAEQGTDDRTMMEFFNWNDPRLIKRYAAASAPNLRRAGALLVVPDLHEEASQA